jgi:hypothetical protein
MARGSPARSEHDALRKPLPVGDVRRSKRFAGNDRKMRMSKPLVDFYVRRMSASRVPDSPLDCLPGKSVTVSTPHLNRRRGPHGDRLERTISEQIAALPGMNKEQLLAIWKENFGKAAPPHLRKQLMVPVLAYRIQEREYGGHAARTRLRELAESLESKSPRTEKVITEEAAESGSRFVRSWHGEMHEVLVKPDGFEYRGRVYWVAVEDRL